MEPGQGARIPAGLPAALTSLVKYSRVLIMTTTTSTLHEGILKNVEDENPNTGLALAAVIMAEANRRDHLNGKVVQVSWDPRSGIGVLVEDAGAREHLANAIGLPRKTTRARTGNLIGEARVGVFLGYRVIIWHPEHGL